MDELIKTIMEKTGITEEAARGIIDEVVAYHQVEGPRPLPALRGPDFRKGRVRNSVLVIRGYVVSEEWKNSLLH